MAKMAKVTWLGRAKPDHEMFKRGYSVVIQGNRPKKGTAPPAPAPKKKEDQG